MAAEAIEPIKRCPAKRRVVLVIGTLKGESSVAEVEDWRENFRLSA